MTADVAVCPLNWNYKSETQEVSLTTTVPGKYGHDFTTRMVDFSGDRKIEDMQKDCLLNLVYDMTNEGFAVRLAGIGAAEIFVVLN